MISIHALLAESDLFTKSTYLFAQTISIHALLAESDPRCKTCCKSSLRFLSTLSLRRATRFFGLLRPCLGDFYPRSPCGERLSNNSRQHLRPHFYPRSPCGERPGKTYGALKHVHISIHALLAESDSAQTVPSCPPAGHFYPRSPCGERPLKQYQAAQRWAFLSTLSLRRATLCSLPSAPILPGFLSTLSLRRATPGTGISYSVTEYFYPRSPCGERLRDHRATQTDSNFYPRSPCGERRWWRTMRCAGCPISIHALLAESDQDGSNKFLTIAISIHALLAESDDTSALVKLLSSGFLSTLSLRRATLQLIEAGLYKSISIHALLAESDPCGVASKCSAAISIHAHPREPAHN